jgi:hypothetical protein
MTASSTNVSEYFQNLMLAGFVVHLVGAFADATYAASIKSVHKVFKIFALIFVSAYSLAWVIWLVWLIVYRYANDGLLCSG